LQNSFNTTQNTPIHPGILALTGCSSASVQRHFSVIQSTISGPGTNAQYRDREVEKTQRELKIIHGNTTHYIR